MPRKKVVEGGVNPNNKGGAGPPIIMGNAELERATVDKCRRACMDTDISLVVFRLNAWEKGEEEAQGNKGKKNQADGVPEDEILEKYGGTVYFSVDHIKGRPPFVFAKSRGRSPPGCTAPPCAILDHDKVSQPHCNIKGPNYPVDYVWITDKSQHGTFVNGKRIPKGERYMLVDGDLIGIGAPHHSISDHWGEDKKKRGFVFKVRSLKRCGEEEIDVLANNDSNNPRCLALNNNVIVGEILSFLAHAELKSARLVNHFWKGLADPKIIPRSIVQFGTHFIHSHSLLTSDIIGVYNFPNWKLSFWRNSEVDEEFYGKMMNILQEKGHLIRDLKLTMPYDSQEDETRFIRILHNLPQLSTLRLHLRNLVKCDQLLLQQESRPPINLPVFPSVTHFSIGGGDFHESPTKEWKGNIIPQAAKLFPNIHCITIAANIGLKSILEQISLRNLWSTGLTQLSSEGWIFVDEQQPVFDLVRALAQPLTKLKLHGGIPPFQNLTDVASFENMLSKHSQTLEHLSLKFQTNKKPDGIKPKFLLKFPTFPKLKVLEFLCDHPEDLDFQIIFPSSSGTISYENDFPQLRVLQLFSFEERNNYQDPLDRVFGGMMYGRMAVNFNTESILDIFIPKDSSTVSRTLRWIQFILERKTRAMQNRWYREFVDRFRRLFPHVHHPQLIQDPEAVKEWKTCVRNQVGERPPTPPIVRMLMNECQPVDNSLIE